MERTNVVISIVTVYKTTCKVCGWRVAIAPVAVVVGWLTRSNPADMPVVGDEGWEIGTLDGPCMVPWDELEDTCVCDGGTSCGVVVLGVVS